MVAILASPNQSQLNLSSCIPLSLLNTTPPVRLAISSKTSFLLSPKSGAFTAHTLTVPLILFTIKVARASLSISSAITNNDFPCAETACNIGNNSFTVFNLWSKIRIAGLSKVQDIVLLSVTK